MVLTVSGATLSAGHGCTALGRSRLLVTGGNTAAGPTNKTWVLKFTQPGELPMWEDGPELPESGALASLRIALHHRLVA
jgi:hypothetical protein